MSLSVMILNPAFFKRALLAAFLCLGLPAFAQNGPAALNISGGLYYPNGTPILQSSVNFKIEILDKNKACVLYSEVHLGEDLSSTNGNYSLQIGSGSSAQNLLAGGAALTPSVFLNPGPVAAFTGCGSGVTLSPGDERLIRISYDLAGGSSYTTMSPEVPIVSSAYAMVAETLQGKTAADFLQVQGTATSSLNQTNAEYAFSLTNWPKLKDLIDGLSSQYLRSNPTAPVNFNGQVLSNVAAPGTTTDAVNKGYADSYIGGKQVDLSLIGVGTGGGDTLIWDQAQNKWVAGAPNLGNSGVAAGSYGSATQVGTFTVGADGRLTAASNVTISGVTPGGAAGGDLTGTYPNPTIANDKITSAKIKSSGIAVNQLIITDNTSGNTLTYAVCNLDEVMKWTASGWACASVASLSPVTSVAGKTGIVTLNTGDISGLGLAAVKDYGTAAGDLVQLDGTAHIPWSLLPVGTGTITAVTAGNYLTGGGLSGNVTLNVDVGVGANQVLALNGSSKIPAVDGSLLTNINAVKLQSRDVASTAPVGGQVLGYNAASSVWEPMSTAVGSVTSVSGGPGLVGGPITSSGSLYVDMGTGANQVVQLNGSSQIPAVDGSLLTSVNAVKLQTYSVANTAPAANQVLKWNGSTNVWEPQAEQNSGGTVTYIATGTGLLGGPVSATGTLTADVGSSAGKLVMENAGAQIAQQNGSVATPAYSFSGNTSTGIYSPGANQLALSANGIASLYIDAGNRVGVNTTSPTAGASLEVSGTGTGASTLLVPRDTTANRPTTAASVNGMIRYNSNNNAFEFFQNGVWATYNTGSSGGSMSSFIAGNGLLGGTIANNGTVTVDVGSSANKIPQLNGSSQMLLANGGSSAPTYAFSNSANTGLYSPGAGTAALATYGTARLTIDSSGNVGIGTTSPASPLDIQFDVSGNTSGIRLKNIDGSAGSASGIQFYSDANRGSIWLDNGTNNFYIGAGSTDIVFQSTTFTGAAERMRINSGGSVGIGTATPASGLDVATTGTGASALIVPRDTTANRPTTAASVNGMIRYNSNNNAFEFFQNGVWATYNTGSAGSVNFPLLASPGTTPPSAPSYSFAGNTNSGLFSQSAGTMALVSGGTTAVTVTGSKVGIGLTNPQYALDVNGGINAAGSIEGINGYFGGWDNTFAVSVGNGNSTSAHYPYMQIDNFDGTGFGGSGSLRLTNSRGSSVSTNPTVSGDVLGSVLFWGSGGAAGSATLQVNAGSMIQAAATQTYTSTSALGSNLIFSTTANGSGSTTERMRIDQNGNVGIGTTSPASGLDVATTGTGASTLIVPRDTTANRPTTAASVNGMIRYNSNNNAFEFFQNGIWATYNTGSAGSVAFPLLASPGTTPPSAPSYSFTGNTNSGLFSQSAGTMALVSGGTTAVSVVGGNVGIGTASPAVLLNVAGSNTWASEVRLENQSSGSAINPSFSAYNWASTFGGYPTVGLFNARGSKGSPAAVSSGDTLGTFAAYGYDTSTNGFGGSLAFVAAETFTTTHHGADLTLSTTPIGSTAAAERLRITNAGNIGVGTASPSSGLDIATTGTGSSTLIVPRDTTANRPTTAASVNGMIRYNSNNNAFEFFQNGVWATYNTGSGGSVSFPLLASPGTTPPSAPSYSFTGSTNTGLFSPAVGKLALSTLGTTALTIDGSGRVGIGVSSGLTYGLTVTETAAGPGIAIYGAPGINNGTADINMVSAFGTASWDLSVQDSLGQFMIYDNVHSKTPFSVDTNTPSSTLVLKASGNVGVGTASPAAGLDIAATGSSSAIIVPRDTTGNRPTGVNGMIRYASDNNHLEVYTNGAWNPMAAINKWVQSGTLTSTSTSFTDVTSSTVSLNVSVGDIVHYRMSCQAKSSNASGSVTFQGAAGAGNSATTGAGNGMQSDSQGAGNFINFIGNVGNASTSGTTYDPQIWDLDTVVTGAGVLSYKMQYKSNNSSYTASVTNCIIYMEKK